MNKHLNIWCGLFIILSLCCGCNKDNTTAEMLYTNTDWDISFSYPTSWIIRQEGYQSVTLSPSEEQEWRPQKPVDIANNPFVAISIGEASVPPNYSSDLVNVDALREWLTKHSIDGPNREFVETSINGQITFEVTEVSVPGCERVVYWRPTSIENMVRLSTGCESPYMEDFERIVKSIQESANR
jgi:hypothetical protein